MTIRNPRTYYVVHSVVFEMYIDENGDEIASDVAYEDELEGSGQFNTLEGAKIYHDRACGIDRLCSTNKIPCARRRLSSDNACNHYPPQGD